MPPAARLTDLHTSPTSPPGVPLTLPEGAGPELTGGLPAGQAGDTLVDAGPAQLITGGLATATTVGVPGTEAGDQTAPVSKVVLGSKAVIVGD